MQKLIWCFSINLQIPSGLPRNLEAAVQRYGSATFKAPVATVLDPNGKLTITLSYGKLCVFIIFYQANKMKRHLWHLPSDSLLIFVFCHLIYIYRSFFLIFPTYSCNLKLSSIYIYEFTSLWFCNQTKHLQYQYQVVYLKTFYKSFQFPTKKDFPLTIKLNFVWQVFHFKSVTERDTLQCWTLLVLYLNNEFYYR